MNKIIEFVKLRMKQMHEKYDDIIGEGESYEWEPLFKGAYCPVGIVAIHHYIGNSLEAAYPSLDFIKFLLNEAQPQTKLVEDYMDRLDSWFGRMYAKAKENEEKILQELNRSEAYNEYKSLKASERTSEQIG